MQITDLNIFLTETKFDGQTANTRFVWHRKQAVFIELTSACGFSGWGECWTFDYSADSLIRFIQSEIKDSVTRQHIENISDFTAELFSGADLSGRHDMLSAALSGVNCALWDLKARAAHAPLYKILPNSRKSRKIPVYASGGLYTKGDTPESLQKTVAGYVEQGFRTVKIKFGARPFSEDYQRILSVRNGIGTDVDLILDAVYSLDRDKATRWLPYWKEWDIKAIQAPFKAHKWELMTWLNKSCTMPVMAFEAETRYEIFRALLERDAIGIMQFSPILVGGMDASMRLIRLAERFDKKVTLQCSSTWMAELISMHLAGAFANIQHVEYHQFHQMMYDRADPACRKIVNGQISLTENTGLGFHPPKARLVNANHSLPDLDIVGKNRI